MERNSTHFRIILDTGVNGIRWLICDPVTRKEIAYSATWDGAVIAAKAIEKSGLTPIADGMVATRSFRETTRFDHLAKVIVERLKERAGV